MEDQYTSLPIAKRTRQQKQKLLEYEARWFCGSGRGTRGGASMKTVPADSVPGGNGSVNVKNKKKRGVFCSEKAKMGKRDSEYGAQEAKRDLKRGACFDRSGKPKMNRRGSFVGEDVLEAMKEEDVLEMEEDEEFCFRYDDKDYVIKRNGTQYCFDENVKKGKGCRSVNSEYPCGLKRKYVENQNYGMIKNPGLRCFDGKREKPKANEIVINLDSSSDEESEKRNVFRVKPEALRIPKEECPSSSEEDVSSEESYSFSEDEDGDESEDEWLDEDNDQSTKKRLKRRRLHGSKVLNLTKKNVNVRNVASRKLSRSNLGASTSRLHLSAKGNGSRFAFNTKETDPSIVIDIDDEDNEDIPVAVKEEVRVQTTSSNINPEVVGAKEVDHSHDDSNEVEELCTVADDCSVIHGNKEVDEKKEGDAGDRIRTTEEIGKGNGHRETVNEQVDGEKEGNLEEPTKTKPLYGVPKDVSLFKLFVSTIWEKGGNLGKEETIPEVEVKKPIYKFRYGVEEPKPVEKSENDLFLDELWAEYDFVVKSLDIGSLVDSENHRKQSVRKDQSSLCSDGQHDFILDEQIGIKCRCCLFVKTEIRNIFPPLDTTCRYRGYGKKRCIDTGDVSMWEGLHFDNNGGGSQCSNDNVEGTVWDLFPRIRDHMYPHQQEGFEFLWRNIAGGIETSKFKKPDQPDSIGGCVISHAPGTGKTLLTIAFLQSYMEVFKECRAVIIAPCSMLLTWEEEFKKWKARTPFHNLNSLEFTGKEDQIARELIPGNQNKNSKKWTRMVKLLSWSKGGSILGLSYSLFGKLSKGRSTKDVDGKEAEEIGKILLEKPSLLVLDEGHTPRNRRSRIWKALQKIKTERRIILSGTPFQNNFEELYNTLSLARPKFLDSIPSAKTEKKEARGKWTSLTSCIGKDADVNLEEVRAMMVPFVHVHKGSILKDKLPGLRDCVVVLNPPPLQMRLLEGVKSLSEQSGFELEHAISLVSLHPSLLIECGNSKTDRSILDQIASKGLNLDDITSPEFRLDAYKGVKTRFLLELIPLTLAKKEKILVFSQYINHPFTLIKDQLHHYFNWTEGEEVLQMDGTDSMKHRQSMINHFNDPTSKVRVLLASIKACNEGINLVGASRVVLLDVVWNPSVERQAISRAYRLGQTKVVYTYQLITSDTMEGEKLRKQVSKDRLSKLVFSSAQAHKDKQSNPSTIHVDAILDEMVGSKKLNGMFREIIYQPKEADLVDTFI